MHTKEAPPPSNEYSRSYERSSVSGDTLRSSLLSAGEAREVVLPENTFAIRCDSRNFSPQTVEELSHWVDEEREYRHQKSTTGHMAPTAWEARSLATLDGEMKFDRMDGKTPSNITILYDKNTRGDEGEVHVPSAVIVHQELSSEQIQNIREALPVGVPIIDGETNQLLDYVGQAEREMGREVNEIYYNLGGAAFRASWYDQGFDDIVTHFSDEYKDNPYNFRRETVDGVWMNPNYFAGAGMYEPRTESSYNSSTKGDETRIEEPVPLVPESDEIRAYRTKEKMEQAEINAHAENDRRNINKASDAIFDAARDLYDVSDLSGLDDKQLRKVERKVQGKLHPDRGFDEGGDIGAFKETGVIMDEIRQQKAAQSGNAENMD